MTKFIPSGGSLNHVSGRARDWFSHVEGKDDWSLLEQIEAAREAWNIAEIFCSIVNCPLRVLIKRASGKTSIGQPFLAVPDALSRCVELTCRDVSNDSTRYTAKSRAKWGISLVRFVVTLARFGDLNLLKILAASSKAADGSNDGSTAASTAAMIESDGELMATVEGRLTTGQARDCAAIFRKSITAADLEGAPSGAFFPENFGLNLQKLHRLTQNMLGKHRVRGDLSHQFESAAPQRVQIDHESLPSYVSLMSSTQIDAEGIKEWENSQRPSAPVISAMSTGRHFQKPQWELPQAVVEEIDEDKYRVVVKAVRRKRVTVEGARHQPSFSYGTPRKIEEAFASGRSVIVSGISGTGKSTLLAKLPTLGATVFQLGGEASTSNNKHFVYMISEADQMIEKANRTRGRKILIAHEFFIGPRLLEKLGVFDQFALVGDPRQPGARGNSSHLFRFIEDLGGRSFTLSVVWRSSNPLMMMALNYFAYGSRYKICTRNFTKESGVQFEFMVCDDSADVVAACMLSYALQKVNTGKSVLLAANNDDLVKALQRHLSLTPRCPDNLRCTYVSDLQGREADVLVVDLHDVAVSSPKPDDALRFFIMLLGRARETTCFALGTRNMCTDPGSVWPIEVYAGVVLRHRVRSSETKTLKRSGRSFEILSQTFNLVAIDEETVAMMTGSSGVTSIMLIKNRESHNVSMIKDIYVTIEVPEMFSDCDIEHHCYVLLYFIAGKYVPGRGKVYLFSELEEFVKKHK